MATVGRLNNGRLEEGRSARGGTIGGVVREGKGVGNSWEDGA